MKRKLIKNVFIVFFNFSFFFRTLPSINHYQSTDAIIDREAEKRNMLLMSELGCAKPLYAVFANGLCYGYVHGQCLDVDSVRHPEVNRLVAAEMAKIHTVMPEGK